jgi:glucose/arabinose dehydrogenase
LVVPPGVAARCGAAGKYRLASTSALRAVITLAGLLAAVLVLSTPSAEAATLPEGFADETVWSGLTNPLNLEFAPDGTVFVAEKGGEIKVFDSIADTSPSAFGTGLATAVHDFWDRGLLGLAIDPQFPTRPYVLYTYDHVLGSGTPPPRWGDGCPNPPAPPTRAAWSVAGCPG